jgi:hypothetical protein
MLEAILFCLLNAAFALAFSSVQLDLSGVFDNKAAATDGSANFDGAGASYDIQFLPAGTWEHDEISVSHIAAA